MRGQHVRALAGLAVVVLATAAWAQDWDNVPLIKHSTCQAVNASGASAYTGGFPIRLRGVVIANTEDWLDPTPAYTATYQPWNMGGQAELIVQAVAADDFGGTFCWIGQNYGNVPWHADPSWNYTDARWTAELGRLNFYGGDGVVRPIRRGDLVEVRARTGLFFRGKMNVNEAHDPDPARDFEVVLLQENYGTPAPVWLSLSDLKDAGDAFLFDATRATGPEHYQATLVTISNVRLTADSIARWGRNVDAMLEDGAGRTLPVRLCNNPAFASSPPPTDWFHVTGVFDQADGSAPHDSGYRLLAMSPADFVPVPEPATLVLAGAVFALAMRRRTATARR